MEKQQALEERSEPIVLTTDLLRSLENAAALRAATFSVERTNAPILLISGEDDQRWPSSLLSEMVIPRRQHYGYRYPFHHIAYPAAGHLIRFPYQPTTVAAIHHLIAGRVFAVGSTPPANAFATADSSARGLTFLAESLLGRQTRA